MRYLLRANRAHVLSMNHTIDKNTSTWLDVIRALAAQAVVFGHLHQLFFSGEYSAPDTKTYKLAWFMENTVSSFSHQAVIAFFVMSGYLVGSRVVAMSCSGSFKPVSYMRDRLVRLWIVLLPAIAITAVLDRIALRYGDGWHIFMSRSGFYPAWFMSAQPWSALHTITNGLFLQMMIGYQYRSNLALWSISNEFW